MRRHVFDNVSPGASAAEIQERLHQSEFYVAYMASAAWAKRRRTAIRLSGGQCTAKESGERCPRKDSLEVHHKTYERLGRERQTDLQVLCHGHHLEADKKRAEQTRKRFTSWLIGWG